MTSEVHLDLHTRTVEVVIDGEVEWRWNHENRLMVLSPQVLRALCLNAFALKADLLVSESRLEAAFALLREKEFFRIVDGEDRVIVDRSTVLKAMELLERMSLSPPTSPIDYGTLASMVIDELEQALDQRGLP